MLMFFHLWHPACLVFLAFFFFPSFLLPGFNACDLQTSWQLIQNNQYLVFPGGSVVKNPSASAGDVGLIPDRGRSLEKEVATHPVFLPGEPNGQRNLAGYHPWGCKSQIQLSDWKSIWAIVTTSYRMKRGLIDSGIEQCDGWRQTIFRCNSLARSIVLMRIIIYYILTEE